ncbi:FkbM family methyltransferase [Ectothiorhodospira lacustris]|uniref:FkbM family methyltransferase n=1 Tax=Ectothiorhodospira lacustris TaxID=2899127 RepID=UPI001EE87D7B|nr:FkbM family methyltransferase [Ectothiorhodospira lacustris]MCG5510348.1 FkbM family methyltransferase [Ectothiorhodospira lacustris]MCG5522094.1 FkbM family methyltransferase [Ectothiorhodospira lacustris]
MKTLYRIIAKTPNYLRKFGIIHGIRLLFSMETRMHQAPGTIKQYQTPGYPSKIHLRKTVSDHSIFWQCLVLQQYDISGFPQSKNLINQYHKMISEGKRPLIIDCGGNIGLSTLFLGLKFPEAQIIVVEPDRANYEILKSNIKALGDRATPLLGGVWSQSGHLRIINPDSGSAAFKVDAEDSEHADTVPSYTINDICKQAGTDAPFIIKIDIEGAQSNLFQKNLEWVKNTNLIMMELDDWRLPWQGTSRSFFSCVSTYPFDYLLSGETIFCFRDFGT